MENWRVLLQLRWGVIHLWHPQGRGRGSQDFRQFCEWSRMVVGDGLTLLDIHMYMKQFFLSMISEVTLNFFASQLFYCFLETCLICSPAMKRHEVRKNFMRFGSSSVLLFSYHAFILLRYLNIACLLFKYFDLTVEAFL